MANQKSTQLRTSDLIQSRSRQHHNIKIPKRSTMMPETFPDNSLYPVTRYRSPDSPARNHHAKTSLVTTVHARVNTYLFAGRPQSSGQDAMELSCSDQPGGAWEKSSFYDVESVTQALSLLRPFARRLLIKRRPAFVAMRARKPWRRLRLMLLG